MTTKSISLNQKTRDEIAHKLTLQATREAAGAFKAEFKAMNDWFWAQHQQRVTDLSGLSAQTLRELIQAGMIRAESTVKPQVSKQSKHTDKPCWGHAFKDRMEEGDQQLLIDLDLFDRSYGPVGQPGFPPRREIVFVFKAPSAVPHLDGMDVITDDNVLLLLASQMHRLLTSAREFRAEAMKILSSCRTSRQLEDVWPEAAKLVPKPKDTSKSMVPQDAIDRVRDQLRNGIPA